QPGGPGAGGGLTRTEVAVGASCPAGVEVGAPAATAARQSLLQESSAPGIGSASAAGRPGAAANALSPGATSVAIKPDAPSELGDVVIGPTPRGGAAKATAEAAPALAAVDEPVAVARAATAASGPPGAAGGAALN